MNKVSEERMNLRVLYSRETDKIFSDNIAEYGDWLEKRLATSTEETQWLPVDVNTPDAKRRVYVICEAVYENKLTRYQTMAEFIPKMSVPEEDYMSSDYWGDGDYNEDDDIYYTPEGWYEWQSVPDMNWKISDKVTHWKPLLELPC